MQEAIYRSIQIQAIVERPLFPGTWFFLLIQENIEYDLAGTRTVILVEDLEEYQAAGADVVLMKGILAASLLKQIESLVSV